ncbi:thiamine diphosphokinase [Fructilactobacillus sanfranciscensis]|uniref:thiamine diphosphokinase n=1 Tax=Fructilactobacillus sanfranciscensis TaxID=1625 RepID=UPI001EEFFD05|nr:thiamine diphosphokinase [Fructilactobacillus sanfranciscensis]MCG7194183.1 thiamine diphosphokinase [Fructilactobacillus sanfranciscensis]
MQKINLLVGGPKTEWPTELVNGKIKGPFIGVDRGALKLLELGITPLAAVGDFDSVNHAEMKLIEAQISSLHRSNPIKDETDTEIAIKYVMKHFPESEIDIYGFSGGRLDQLMTNLLMLQKPIFNSVVEKVTLLDQQNCVRFFKPGKHQIDKINGMKYLDFVNFENCHLTLFDEMYTLKDHLVLIPTSFSSNEFMHNHATFEFDKGILTVIQSKD